MTRTRSVTAPRAPRLRALRPAANRSPRAVSRPDRDLDRALLALGADPTFVEALLGDLAEERAQRAARDGAAAARRWYVREALHSTPYLLRHVVRHVLRHGTPRQRRRLAAGLAGLAGAASLAALAWSTRNGPPARLALGAGAGAAEDGLVVNEIRPVRLPVRVLDAAGHVLEPAGLRYRQVAGIPIPVTRAGVVTCTRRGDALVRASLGALAADVVVHCEPVREARAAVWNSFLLGDPPRPLPLDFVGLDGRPVTRLRARVRVEDSTVAVVERTPEGLAVRPRASGRTHVWVSVGDRAAGGEVQVFAPVPAPDAMRRDRPLVAAPVRLAAGAAVRWPLPLGLFSLEFLPDRRGGGASSRASPGLAVDGAVMCMPALRPGVTSTFCLARAPGATVTVTAPKGASGVAGALALARWPGEDATPSDDGPP